MLYKYLWFCASQSYACILMIPEVSSVHTLTSAVFCCH